MDDEYDDDQDEAMQAMKAERMRMMVRDGGDDDHEDSATDM